MLASLWQTEFDTFYDELQAAEQRGVRLALVHYGSPARRLGATFHHPVEETIRRERGGCGLTLVVDQRYVVIATYFDDGRVEAAWSRNRAFVFVAEDFVRHDVYITKVTATMDNDLKRTFGADYGILRDVFQAVEPAS